MLQHSPDEPQSGIAELSIALLIVENGLAVFEQMHMHMHATAGLPATGLGRKVAVRPSRAAAFFTMYLAAMVLSAMWVISPSSTSISIWPQPPTSGWWYLTRIPQSSNSMQIRLRRSWVTSWGSVVWYPAFRGTWYPLFPVLHWA